jgi:hypothetical protein
VRIFSINLQDRRDGLAPTVMLANAGELRANCGPTAG